MDGLSIRERQSWPLWEMMPTAPVRSRSAEMKAKADTLST